VTHDRAFLDHVATAILAFERDAAGGPARVTRFAGGYQDYLGQRGERANAPSAPAPRVPAAPKPREKSGLTYAERLELDGILERVDAAEKAVSAIEALLADPALYAQRGHEVAALQARLATARQDAAKLTARWEELEAKR